MSNVHVLVVDGSHWVREEDYREVEQKLAETRAALRDVGAINSALTWIRWEEEHAAAIKAAREAK